MDQLNTINEVFDALGGISAVATLTGRKYTATHNWKAFQRFPPNTYVVMTQSLAERGKAAPASLWGMSLREQLIESIRQPKDTA